MTTGSEKDHELANVHGKRLLPSLLDTIAASTPDRIFASISRTQEVSDGFDNITFGSLAHAVNHTAHKLRKSHGISSDLETLTFFGVTDIRYTIFFLAAVKCGYKVSILPHKLFSSYRT